MIKKISFLIFYLVVASSAMAMNGKSAGSATLQLDDNGIAYVVFSDIPAETPEQKYFKAFTTALNNLFKTNFTGGFVRLRYDALTAALKNPIPRSEDDYWSTMHKAWADAQSNLSEKGQIIMRLADTFVSADHPESAKEQFLRGVGEALGLISQAPPKAAPPKQIGKVNAPQNLNFLIGQGAGRGPRKVNEPTKEEPVLEDQPPRVTPVQVAKPKAPNAFAGNLANLLAQGPPKAVVKKEEVKEEDVKEKGVPTLEHMNKGRPMRTGRRLPTKRHRVPQVAQPIAVVEQEDQEQQQPLPNQPEPVNVEQPLRDRTLLALADNHLVEVSVDAERRLNNATLVPENIDKYVSLVRYGKNSAVAYTEGKKILVIADLLKPTVTKQVGSDWSARDIAVIGDNLFILSTAGILRKKNLSNWKIAPVDIVSGNDVKGVVQMVTVGNFLVLRKSSGELVKLNPENKQLEVIDHVDGAATLLALDDENFAIIGPMHNVSKNLVNGEVTKFAPDEPEGLLTGHFPAIRSVLKTKEGAFAVLGMNQPASYAILSSVEDLAVQEHMIVEDKNVLLLANGQLAEVTVNDEGAIVDGALLQSGVNEQSRFQRMVKYKAGLVAYTAQKDFRLFDALTSEKFTTVGTGWDVSAMAVTDDNLWIKTPAGNLSRKDLINKKFEKIFDKSELKSSVKMIPVGKILVALEKNGVLSLIDPAKKSITKFEISTAIRDIVELDQEAFAALNMNGDAVTVIEIGKPIDAIFTSLKNKVSWNNLVFFLDRAGNLLALTVK